VLVGLAVVFVGIGFVEYHTRTLLFNPKVIDANQFATYFRVNSLFFDPKHLRAVPGARDAADHGGAHLDSGGRARRSRAWSCSRCCGPASC